MPSGSAALPSPGNPPDSGQNACSQCRQSAKIVAPTSAFVFRRLRLLCPVSRHFGFTAPAIPASGSPPEPGDKRPNQCVPAKYSVHTGLRGHTRTDPINAIPCKIRAHAGLPGRPRRSDQRRSAQDTRPHRFAGAHPHRPDHTVPCGTQPFPFRNSVRPERFHRHHRKTISPFSTGSPGRKPVPRFTSSGYRPPVAAAYRPPRTGLPTDSRETAQNHTRNGCSVAAGNTAGSPAKQGQYICFRKVNP